MMAFIGLIVPHLLRLVTGADHRRLILPTALGGALLLVLADTGARTLASPAEIPVGIFTAVTGAPVSSGCCKSAVPPECHESAR